MPSRRKVKFGVVGVGNIGEVHASNLATKIHDAELAAIVDSDKARLEAAKERFGVEKAMTSYDDLLADSGIEAVVLSVPTFLKEDMVVKAVKAGKNVFVEKPMTLSLEQADAIVNAVKSAEVKFQVGYQRRFDHAFVKARRAIEAGDLGRLQMITSRTRDPPGNPQGWLTDPRLSGGIWLDTVSHDFDCIRFLTGKEAVKVYAEAANLVYDQLKPHGDYDNVVVTLKMSDGALAYVDSCAYTPYGYDIRVEVVGTKAASVVEMGSNSAYSLLGTAHSLADAPQTYQERFGQAYHDEIEDFAACIIEDRKPKASYEEGRAAIKIGLAAAESVNVGRPVSIS